MENRFCLAGFTHRRETQDDNRESCFVISSSYGHIRTFAISSIAVVAFHIWRLFDFGIQSILTRFQNMELVEGERR